MTHTADYLAFDLGASGGRAMLGRFDGARVSLAELHRFANGPVQVRGGLYWDALRLLEEIRTGLRCTGGAALDGIGVDTWGVDYALLARGGELLAMPRHYRDPRTDGVMERAFERVPRERIYAATGIQFMQFNTLFQLLATAGEPAGLLDCADRLLFMPDLFIYWLTGVSGTERTIASTSQLLDANSGEWSAELLEGFALPARVLPEIVRPGTVAGPLSGDLARDAGAVPVIRSAGHDTAAAVAAVPAAGRDWAYISSGTWSLVGAELDRPILSPAALAANFTNEAGVAGTTRFLKNVAGLWLVQECRRVWAEGGRELTYAELARLAAAAPPLAAFVDPDDARFAAPGDMPGRIRAACRETGQPEPATPGAIVRCALESLALKYRTVLESLETLLGRRIGTVHVVGGGVHNELLCQFTADASGKPVVAGPAEATAVGNVMVQALARGRVTSLEEVRHVVAASFQPRRYEPRDPEAWTAALQGCDSLRG